MAHEYSVQTTDGRSYDVTTQNHHSNHDDKTFRQHLLDVIKQSASQIIAGVVVHHYTYKGPR